MKVLVTGGAGYIGSVVTAQLCAAGHDVTVLDDLSTGHLSAVPRGVPFIEADISRASSVLDSSFDAVLHFAAKSLVGESVTDPQKYWDTNVAGTQALLDAMREAGVPRIVFSSTAAVYGEPDVTPITEETTPAPINPYGQSKLAVDHMLSSYAHAYNLAAVSLRYFNVGGALRTDLGFFGERHDPETHLIPNVLAVPAGKRSKVQIFGDDYPTSDGTAVRDYLHVEDLGRAHLMALDGAKEGVHRIFNLGTGTGYSVAEVVDAVRAVTGHDVPAAAAERRAGDPATLVASARKIETELGWIPEHSLQQIASDAWEFMRDDSKDQS
ncbi:MAG TPA: UDP-glucose 4-epimerase GalE [Actinomycetales bacterium]|nr:UDP-glucose 4-epimerase GalE [Actinomycetales bacterium]